MVGRFFPLLVVILAWMQFIAGNIVVRDQDCSGGKLQNFFRVSKATGRCSRIVR